MVLVALVALGLYLNALPHGFVYDDVDQVVRNPWIRHPASIGAAFTSGAWDYAGVRSNYYRPLMHVIYLIGYTLFGLWAPGFHLMSVVLHMVVSVLAFRLAELLAADPGPAASPHLVIPTVAGLLFAAHPVHTEAVAWIGGVPDLSLALCCLLSLILYARLPPGRIPSLDPRYLGSVVLFFLATLSKETALVLPALLLTYDIATRWRAVRPVPRLLGYLPYAVVVILYAALRLNALGHLAPVVRHGDLTTVQNVLGVFSLLAAYVGMLVLPAGLNVFHHFRPISSLAEPYALTMVLAGLVVAASGVVFLIRKHRRAFLLHALLLMPLLPVLYVPALGENPFAERYLYLPSLGFILLVLRAGVLVERRRRRLGPALLAGAVCVLGWYSLSVVARNPVWVSDLTLWQDAATKSPGSALVHFNLGAVLQADGQIDAAIREYRTALALEPSPLASNNLGVAYRQAGLTDEAIAVLHRAVTTYPRYALLHSSLAGACLEAGQTGRAIAHLRTAVQLAPGNADYVYNLGRAYDLAGMPREARDSYEAALAIDPGHRAARLRLPSAPSR